MKKMFTALLALLLVLPVFAAAEGTLRLDGTIEAVRVRTVLAPYSGRVEDFDLRAGDEFMAGGTLFEIAAEPVYAEFDGTVTGVFAQPGDSAAYVSDRYGAALYMERDILYRASCTTKGAASENEYKIVHAGEKVYIQSDANNARTGEAIVTSVEGNSFTIEVIAYDDLRVNEDVEVYRDNRYQGSTKIGEGRVKRIDPIAVNAEGYIRSVHVEDGQQVARGDLLFEVVPDRIDGLAGSDGRVTMPADGVVLSIAAESGAQIAKDAPMATYCAKQDMQLGCAVDEAALSNGAVGMEVTVTLDAYGDRSIKGTVVRVSAAGSEQGDFEAIIALEDTALARVGMNATAELEMK